MPSLLSSPAIVGLTALILVFLLTIPTLSSDLKRVSSARKAHDDGDFQKLYEDHDGVATEKSQKAYSAAVPKYIALASSIIGYLASLAAAVTTTIDTADYLKTESWLQFSILVSTLVV